MRPRISLREKIIVLSLFVLCSDQVQAQDFSVTPNQGFQGEALVLEVIANGALFFEDPFDVQFIPGDVTQTSDVFFDTGVDPFNAKNFKVSISISDSATLGKHTIVVTDAFSIYTVNAAFEILCATCGSITKVSPASSMVGKTLDVTVTGDQTHFDQNTSELSFSGSGIQVNSITVTQATVLTASITISASASAGKRTVTVTTGPEVATGSNLFEVTQLPPLELSQTSGKQGAIISNLTITGGPGGYSTPTEVSLGEGIGTLLASATPDGSALTISSFAIDIDAPIGPRDVVLTTSGSTFTTSNAFVVLIGDATTITSINPAAADRGHPGFPVTVTGIHVRFDKVEGHVTLDGGTAYGVNGTALDSNTLAVSLRIGDTTTEGLHNVIVELCPAGESSQYCQTIDPPLIGAFEVTKPGIITITDPFPAVINAGVASTIALSVTDRPLDKETPELSIEPADGVTVTAFTVVDATHANATILVDPAAFGSKRTLRIVIVPGPDPDVAIGPESLKIFNPQIVRVVPTRAYLNTSSVTFTVYGNDLTFDAQSTISISGDGVTASNAVFDPLTPDKISCTLSIDAAATLGKRDVTVTAGSYTVTAAQAFAVIAHQKPYKPTNGCSCSASQEDPLWLGWCMLPLVIFWLIRKRPVLIR